ncbi:hypothetical protein [Rhodococcoides yunnanense]|uniref:hypothetical protein n=1 Tax=Rhodococcoides yunnanense TaxID=278209 RepID=UPI0009320F47|nr:hypothetical protein [Rhodococcus yunnanensis]
MTTAPKPFAAKYSSKTGCAVCGRPIVTGMQVMFKNLGGGKRRLVCASGECAKTAPARFCSTCGQSIEGA